MDSGFDEDKSLIAQLPFFTCVNHFYTDEISKDLERYSYCNNTGVVPYKGSYGNQPASWVKKYFAIKNAYAIKESMMIDKQKAKAKVGK
tara:strand:+ start:2589 stop:2855 length:267 start_codon:yes stop_codon:yes gene_type:complete